MHGLLQDGLRNEDSLRLWTSPWEAQTLYTNLLEELDTNGPFLYVWPSTTFRGCYFHFKQALWRKFSKTDLVPEYQVVESEVRKSFQMIGALPFFTPDDVDMARIHLKPLLPPDMAAFAGYMDYTWLGTSSSDPHGWNQWDENSGMPPSADVLDPPTWRKGGTTASRVSSLAPTRRSGANSWMHQSWNIHSQS